MYNDNEIVKLGNINTRNPELLNNLENFNLSKGRFLYLGDTRGIHLPFLNGQCDKFATFLDGKEEEKQITHQAIPLLREVANILTDHQFMNGSINFCPPNTYQPIHTDSRIFHRFCKRVHLPLVTNEGCFLQINDNSYHLEPYTLYEFNNLFMHRSYNLGTTYRIHILINMMPNYIFEKLKMFMSLDDIFNVDILDNPTVGDNHLWGPAEIIAGELAKPNKNGFDLDSFIIRIKDHYERGYAS